MQNLIPKLKRASPLILTCLGAAGVIATAVTAVKATPEAIKLIEAAKAEKGEDLTKLEIVQTAGPNYIPSVAIGLSTIVCIFGANALNKRQQAALISSYALINNAYKEYRDKVKELLGTDTDVRITESIAKDKMEQTHIHSNRQDLLFYNQLTGKYFESSIESVLAAEYEANKRLLLDGYVSLNDFLELLDNDLVPGGYSVGWSIEAGEEVYGYSCIDFEHYLVEMDDGLECYILNMSFAPTADYLKVRYER